MPNEATLTAAISTEGYKIINDIVAESAILKRLKEAGHRTAKSNVYKAAILHILANLDILENDPMLLTKTGSQKSMDFALRKILGGVER